MFFIEERIKRIVEELKNYINSDNEIINIYKMKQGNFKGGEAFNIDVSEWEPFVTGDRWGGRDLHTWFRTEIRIPERFGGKTVVFTVNTGREGEWDALNPQFLLYINGIIVQGLDVNHRDTILSDNAIAGEVYNIALHGYSGMKEGLVELNSKISILNEDVENLFYNINVPLEIAYLLDKEDKRKIDILNYLNESVNILDLRKPFSPSFFHSIAESNKYMENEFYGKYCGNEDIIAHCVGHTHIDVAWLWTLAQTKEKTARSFSTVLNLMNEYPDYIFMSSQPQLYKYVKEEYPEIYKAIIDRIKEGVWEPEGALWVEADCNLASGESLVRQIIFGKRFFEKEFGVKSVVLWLPDVFGYSAALPQIMKKSGVKYFMTTKISWSEYNKHPYDTFMWRGIDGTEVLTHFITTRDPKFKLNPHVTTYNGNLVPSQVIGAWDRYQQKDINNEVLISYGYGDGGGGPTREMLENAKRMEKGIPGCPKVRLGKVIDYFTKLDNSVSGKRKLPKWVGELYLEYHRGTYTSVARNKKFNRKSEFLLQDLEFISILSNITSASSDYPHDKINQAWETVLLNQFHDILPGSSIREVYEDSRDQYLEVQKQGQDLINKAIDNIASQICLFDTSVVVFNQLSFNRSEIAEVELSSHYSDYEVYDLNGLKVPTQALTSFIKDGKSYTKMIFWAENVPAKGYKTYLLKKPDKINNSAFYNTTYCGKLQVSKTNLINKFFNIRLDEYANVISIFDNVNNREVLKEGCKGNTLLAFEDKPHNHDAWDINIYYAEKMWEINNVVSVNIVENGPVRACIEINRNFLDSSLKQRVYIYDNMPRIDFSTKIDWKEKQILLKAAFPVDIHSDKATYEIQYGNVERPTHWNTSWDYARFEVCAHKWADLSEHDYGVSLMNDCKYGHDIKDGVMRLTLLKSAVEPNADADREIHEFIYSLYPHAGDWRKAGTVQMAYSLNCPLYTKVEESHEGTLPASFSLVEIDCENVIIEVIKKAEDSEDIIIRLYECFNKKTNARLSFFKEISAVWECDLLENNIAKLETKDNWFKFLINPYEIKTFKLRV